MRSEPAVIPQVLMRIGWPHVRSAVAGPMPRPDDAVPPRVDVRPGRFGVKVS